MKHVPRAQFPIERAARSGAGRCALHVLAIAIALWGATASVSGAGADALASTRGKPDAPPEGMPAFFDELVVLVGAAELSPVEWARGTYIATRLLAFGQTGVAYMRNRFTNSVSAEEGTLSGFYIAVFGTQDDHKGVRKSLETDQRKRAWLKQGVGDAAAINRSMQEGERWQTAADLLPTKAGFRSLALLCLQSEDALVRRAGMYWGYWVADEGYWQAVQKVAKDDADSLTKNFAQFLIKRNRARE